LRNRSPGWLGQAMRNIAINNQATGTVGVVEFEIPSAVVSTWLQRGKIGCHVSTGRAEKTYLDPEAFSADHRRGVARVATRV